MAVTDKLRSPGAPTLRRQIVEVLLGYEGHPMNLDGDRRLEAEIEARLLGLVKAAERSGELELPERITTAGELRAAAGTMEWRGAPDHAVLYVHDHDVLVRLTAATRRMEVHLVPIADWHFDGLRVRATKKDTEAAVALYHRQDGP